MERAGKEEKAFNPFHHEDVERRIQMSFALFLFPRKDE